MDVLDALEDDVLDFEDDLFDDEDAWETDDFEDEDDFDLEEGDDLFEPEDVVAMEALGALAAESLEDEEAEDAFIGALASIAAKALPLAKKALPFLKTAGKAIFNRAKRSPAVRSAVKSVPTVLRKTAADQLRRAAAGRKVTLNSTLRSAARNTANVIDNPRKRRLVVRRQQRVIRRGGHQWRRVCRWVPVSRRARMRRR